MDFEQRRGNSQANSVRFDESAMQGHGTQGSRSSVDFLPPRSGSALGNPMMERSLSYKSDGRQSSAGQSFRTNSLRLDTRSLAIDDEESPLEVVGPPPGMFLMGMTPSIIRCWLTTTYSHETLLYAAICTGSNKSLIDRHLVTRLGLEEHMVKQEDRLDVLKIPVYLPEAFVIGSVSHSSNGASQLPKLEVSFTVVSRVEDSYKKSIQVFLGSDTLRRYNADILFSQNSLTLLGHDRSKLSVPLVCPEDEGMFTNLGTVDLGPKAHRLESTRSSPAFSGRKYTSANATGESANGHDSGVSIDGNPLDLAESRESIEKLRASPINSPAITDPPSLPVTGAGRESKLSLVGTVERMAGESRYFSSQPVEQNLHEVDGARRKSVEFVRDDQVADKPSINDQSTHSSTEHIPRRSSGSSPWGSWRRDDGQSSPFDSLSARSMASNRGTRGRNMKVLRPSKTSVSIPARSPSGQNSSTDVWRTELQAEASRKNESDKAPGAKPAKTEPISPSIPKLSKSTTSASTSANPIGGASAFPWLKSTPKKPQSGTAD